MQQPSEQDHAMPYEAPTTMEAAPVNAGVALTAEKMPISQLLESPQQQSCLATSTSELVRQQLELVQQDLKEHNQQQLMQNMAQLKQEIPQNPAIPAQIPPSQPESTEPVFVPEPKRKRRRTNKRDSDTSETGESEYAEDEYDTEEGDSSKQYKLRQRRGKRVMTEEADFDELMPPAKKKSLSASLEEDLRAESPPLEKQKEEKENVVEAILAHREIEQQGSTEEGSSVSEEFLIKWKNKSYIHCTWASEDTILSLDRNSGPTKIKRFWAKWNESMECDKYAEDFPPEYSRVDRLISCAEFRIVPEEPAVRRMYLVKWCNLPYTEATWEHVEDINDDDKIAEFQRFHVPPAAQLAEIRTLVPPVELHFKNGNNLLPHQAEGLDWLLTTWAQGRSALLADEQGLGKNIQAIAMLERLYSVQHIHGPFLLVVSTDQLAVWTKQLNSWTDMNTVVFEGHLENLRRIRKYEWLYLDASGAPIGSTIKFSLLLTTYDVLFNNIEVFTQIPWKVIVLDDAHKIYATKPVELHTLLKLHSDFRLLLTSAPVSSSMGDLWTLLNFVEPNAFKDKAAFVTQFHEIRTQEQITTFQLATNQVMLRRLKADTPHSVPQADERVIESHLSPLQIRLYKTKILRNRVSLAKGCAAGTAPDFVKIIKQLHNIANHPFLHRQAEDKETADLSEEDITKLLHTGSGKLFVLDSLLQHHANVHKTLVLCQSVACARLIAKHLEMSFAGKFITVDGTGTRNQEKQKIDAFCNRKPKVDGVSDQPGAFAPPDILVLCTKVCSYNNIDLCSPATRGRSVVVIFDSDWLPYSDTYVALRCLQEKPVGLYRVLSQKSFDSFMLKRSLRARKVLPPSRGDEGVRNKTLSLLGIALNRADVDGLLKHGIVDLFSDDTSSDQFVDLPYLDISWFREDVAKANTEHKQKPAAVILDQRDFWDKVLPNPPNAEDLKKEIAPFLATEAWHNKREFWCKLKEYVRRVVDQHSRSGKAKKFWATERDELGKLILFCLKLPDGSECKLFNKEERDQLAQWLDDINFSLRQQAIAVEETISVEKHLQEVFMSFGRPCWKKVIERSGPQYAGKSVQYAAQCAVELLEYCMENCPVGKFRFVFRQCLDTIGGELAVEKAETFAQLQPSLFKIPVAQLQNKVRPAELDSSALPQQAILEQPASFLQPTSLHPQLTPFVQQPVVFALQQLPINHPETQIQASSTVTQIPQTSTSPGTKYEIKRRPSRTPVMPGRYQMEEWGTRLRLLLKLNKIAAQPDAWRDFLEKIARNEFQLLEKKPGATGWEAWWNIERDQDLLIGTYNHGWGAHKALIEDNTLCLCGIVKLTSEAVENRLELLLSCL